MMPEILAGPAVLLTLQQVGELLQLSRTTVYRLIDDGHLVTVHVGSAVRVLRGSVEQFVADLAEKSGERASEPDSPQKIACVGGEREHPTG